ncbi:MAG: hypothetical protein LBQ69_03685 [Treponema sp.]|jgi:hypothetical protein|nr:hypothetical protein [Treponema sp.]
MKRPIVFVLALGAAFPLFAQLPPSAQARIPEYRFASGRWQFDGPRLYQNDENARLAKANFRVPQSGAMTYEFSARYEGGAEDGHGGFGLHIFVDSPHNGPSWGAGNSYLLWLNYDEAPIARGIPRGLSAQVYKSTGNSRMDLVESVSLNEYLPLLTREFLQSPVLFRITADGDTGEVRVYNPFDPGRNTYFYFFVDRGHLPLRGEWVALRTNGIKLSFTMD